MSIYSAFSVREFNALKIATTKIDRAFIVKKGFIFKQ